MDNKIQTFRGFVAYRYGFYSYDGIFFGDGRTHVSFRAYYYIGIFAVVLAARRKHQKSLE